MYHIGLGAGLQVGYGNGFMAPPVGYLDPNHSNEKEHYALSVPGKRV